MAKDNKKDIEVSKLAVQFIEPEKEPKASGLTLEQKDQMVKTGAYVAEGLVDIAKNLVEIARIDNKSKADVRIIQAKTDQIVSKLREETEQLRSRGELAQKKSKAVVDILVQMKQIILGLPEADTEVRLRVIDKLPEIIDKALSSG